MEGLVKGLISVALGQGEEDEDEVALGQGEEDEGNRDERSRSTWAQVVSGEQDDHDKSSSSNDRHSGHGYNRKEEERNDGWRSGESRPTMRPQKAVHQEYYRDADSRQDNYNQVNWNRKEEKQADDGWATVGNRPVKQHYKSHKDQWESYKRPLDEQNYSSEVKYDVGFEPSGEELNDLSKAFNKLWELDLNRLVPGKDYQIDCGEGKKVYQKEDVAEGSLFSWLSEEIFMRPTFARFCSLLDNYNPHEGYKENVTSEERQEQAAFIEEISRTAPIKYLHRYLSSKGIASENHQDFKRMMTSLWFDLYGRGGTSGSSSAFEHVFVGEIKQRGEQEVSGFHNWLQFYLEEAKGRVNYQGFILPRRRGLIPDTETQLLTIQFEWNGVLKSVSSTLIGVSPEFEVAIYTLCFYLGREDNHVELGPYSVNIKCYRLGNKIGSAFPVADC